MGVHNLKFAASEPLDLVAGAKKGVGPDKSGPDTLPMVPASLLKRIFMHLNAEERALALQQRLVAVAWLPHTTLYADAAPEGIVRQEDPDFPIVARIAPYDFERAVYGLWRKSLARQAATGLALSLPTFSARAGLPGPLHVLLGAVIIAFGFAVFSTDSMINGIGLLLSIFFLGIIWLRLLVLSEAPATQIDRAEMDDSKLPNYSVLVPLFREVQVLPQILGALQQLNYPKHKLDIKLILEESDTAMRRTLAKFTLPPQFEILAVPAGSPQTKPRALNYALQFARGSLLTIYDAEDIPEPMQLRMAAGRFAKSPQTLACLQAELAFYNGNENWLTRQFTIEYAVLFKLMLPSLARLGWPLPLGGTSNHFRTAVLRAVGGWDAHNVTEDADLGFRLARMGFAVGTLGSTTFEEASSTPRNWIKQRARWLKGFLITWLVHMRQPRTAMDEMGLGGFCVMQASLLGVFAAALLHPLFLGLMGWKIWQGQFAGAGLPALLDCYFLGLIPVSWLVILLAGERGLRSKGIRGWWASLLSMPLYWLCISAAGYLALWEFFRAPFHWNKTQHGVSRLMRPAHQAKRR